jgi:hypothetical protein
MDSQQFHCHFKSHMKSSFHSLIPFLPLFIIIFDCRLSHFSAATANSGPQLNSSQLNSSLYPLCKDRTENTVSSNTYCVFTYPLLRNGFLYCCVRIPCCGNAFARPSLRNGLHNTVVYSPIAWQRLYMLPYRNVDCRIGLDMGVEGRTLALTENKIQVVKHAGSYITASSYWAGLHSGNALDSYSGCARFESWQRYRLTLYFSILLHWGTILIVKCFVCNATKSILS